MIDIGTSTHAARRSRDRPVSAAVRLHAGEHGLEAERFGGQSPTPDGVRVELFDSVTDSKSSTRG